MTFEEVLKQELDIAESWRKVAEGFERDNQRLRAELESDGKIRARLRGCVVWHRFDGDTVRLLPIPAHIEAMRVVVQVKVFEDDGGQARATGVVITHSAPRGSAAAHTGAPGNSTESREDRDVPP